MVVMYTWKRKNPRLRHLQGQPLQRHRQPPPRLLKKRNPEPRLSKVQEAPLGPFLCLGTEGVSKSGEFWIPECGKRQGALHQRDGARCVHRDLDRHRRDQVLQR